MNHDGVSIPILLIDPEPEMAHKIGKYLGKQQQFTLKQKSDLSRIDKIQSNQFKLILVNLHIKEGIECILMLNETLPEIPIIALSDDEEPSIQAVQAGAQDLIVMDELDSINLPRAIRHAMERHRLTLALNNLNKQQQYLATHDILTGLPNRQLLQDRLSQAMVFGQRNNDLFAVLFIDLDSFKTINDSLGHNFGDELLKHVSQRLIKCTRITDTVARLGGDEFVIVATQLNKPKDTVKIARSIIQALRDPFCIQNQELYISASIGIAVFPEDGQNSHTLLKHADIAMYKAKERGRNNYQHFNKNLQISSLQLLTLGNSLRKALDRDEFELHYQPQFDASSNEIIGIEALLRWEHPTVGIIPPSEFIRITEDTGLIVPIGEWVLDTACRQYVKWQEMGIAPERIAVNLSAKQFEPAFFTESIKSILRTSGLKADCLELELTESVIMKSPEDVIKTLNELKNIGVHLSIDDFGTGYSSLNYLKNLPIDLVKIDKSFVTQLEKEPDNEKIVEVIIALTHSLKMNVLAEGVETEKEKTVLLRKGCTHMQGFLFCKPMSSEQTTEYLTTNHKFKSSLVQPQKKSKIPPKYY